MKKCVVVAASPRSEYSGNPGGQQTASKALLDSLSDIGFEVVVIDTLQSSFPVPSIFSRLKKGLSRFLRCFILLRPLQGSCGPDVILLFASSGGSLLERLAICIIARLMSVPSILFLRSGHTQNAIDRSSKPLQTVYRYLLCIPDHIVVQGSSWRFSLESVGIPSSSITVLPNWSSKSADRAAQNTQLSFETVKTQPTRFIYCGWLVPKKGIYEIVESIKLLVQEGRDFEFFFVGGGDLQSYIENELEAEAESGTVKLTGWIDTIRLKAYLTQGSILVLPSHAEGFPNVVVEALAARMPVIACEVGGIGDSIVDGFNGKIVEVGSVHSLIVGLKSFIDDDLCFEVCASNAWNTYLDKHSYASGTNSISSIIDKVSQARK